MALIVEDGTVVANANSYQTVAEITAYALARGVTLTGDIEVLAIQAMDYLEAQRARYQGNKVEPLVQELQFPRYNVYIDCVLFPSDEIPKELQNAQNQLVIELHNSVDILPTSEEAFITEEKIGPITTKYSDTVRTSIEPTMTAVDALLEPLFFACGQKFALTTLRV